MFSRIRDVSVGKLRTDGDNITRQKSIGLNLDPFRVTITLNGVGGDRHGSKFGQCANALRKCQTPGLCDKY
jgi:hypothetical protein